MKQTRTYTYRLAGISKGKRRQLDQLFAGMCLWYNFFVAQCKAHSRLYRKWIDAPDKHDKPKPLSYYDWCRLITAQERAGGVPNKEGGLIDTSWLPRFAKCNAAKRVNLAFKAFLKGQRGFPRFRPFHRMQSFEVAAVHASLRRVAGSKWAFLVPGIQVRLKFTDTRGILEDYDPKKRFTGVVRVVRHPLGAGYDIQITRTDDVPDPEPDQRDAVGIDMGVRYTATLSNGKQYAKLDVREPREKKLQRKLSKGKYGSRSRIKKRTALAKEKRRSALRRKNALHRITADIITNHSANVAIEDLNLRNMTRSAKGTAEDPGKNVKAKAGLNREMLNNALGEFTEMLSYKAKRAGGEIVEVNAAFTSQTCSRCGYCAPANRKTQARFVCQECGYSANADVNAARNIGAEGFPESFSRPIALPARGPDTPSPDGVYGLPLLSSGNGRDVSGSTTQDTIHEGPRSP